MATTHGLVVGGTVSVPQFYFTFRRNAPGQELSTDESSNFRVPLGLPPSFASCSPLRNRKASSLSCRCSSSNVSSVNTGTGSGNSRFRGDEWDWNRWSRHISEVEEAEGFASLLKFQLEEAIEKEDFHEAAKLKTAIAEATSKDTVAEIMSELQTAIDEERYHDASRLCRETGSGLVGWWVGYSHDSEDPFGRIVRITPGVGRFVGKSYSPRQLVTAASGTPLFEIFVVKHADGAYFMKVMYLQRAKGNSSTSEIPSLKDPKSPSGFSDENPSMLDIQGSEMKVDKNEKRIDAEEATEEGIKSIINFLKDKIPGLKLKVMNVNIAEEEIIGNDDTVEQLIQEDTEKMNSSNDPGEELDNIEEIKSVDGTEGGNDLGTKLFIGGVLHNNEDSSTKDEHVRVSAAIRDVRRDSFVLHIPNSILGHDEASENKTNVRVTAVAAQGISELMPPEVANAFWSSEKASSKVSRNVREIVKLAISQAQKRNRLFEYTTFNRISTSKDNLDPFDGLYVGAFGPYGTEVVELRRKYGRWNDAEHGNSDLEFFEYVEAVKLTGDLNVPAGQVTFRAKVGRGNRLSNHRMYPEELGVSASFKGEGRIADLGFKNPKWVEGELLQLNGKGMGPYVKGADLGFLYVVPEQSFLVLFNRLNLPE